MQCKVTTGCNRSDPVCLIFKPQSCSLNVVSTVGVTSLVIESATHTVKRQLSAVRSDGSRHS